MATATAADLLSVATQVCDQLKKVSLLKPGMDNDLARATLEECLNTLAALDSHCAINRILSQPSRQSQTLFASSQAAIPHYDSDAPSQYRP